MTKMDSDEREVRAFCMHRIRNEAKRHAAAKRKKLSVVYKVNA